MCLSRAAEWCRYFGLALHSLQMSLRYATTAALLALLLTAPGAHAQVQPFETRWLGAGDFHTWYGAMGSERQNGAANSMQWGSRWPGIYEFNDAQVAKGLWIGAQNVTDPDGTAYPVRVVHVGPRVAGVGSFFPTRFDLTTRFPLPSVSVDGLPSFPRENMVADAVDPAQAPEAMITNEVNTLLGITMRRRVMQFSQAYHDDYHLSEYTFTNTGNMDADAEIELPNQTLEGVVFYFQSRFAIARETRWVIGNGTGWGKNTMLDARGDGVRSDPPREAFRTQFAWHGYHPPFTDYDNIGGPIMPPALPALGIAPSDTLGRLGASQFVGVVTLHADQASGDTTDDPNQPSTTNWPGSDEAYQTNNDPFNIPRMTTEYGVMTEGHESPRHAWAVEPEGMPGWLNPTNDPSLGTAGGFSMGNGYGPYTLAPGESVRIVVAEAAGGLSREANVALGRAWKAANYDPRAALTYNGETMNKNKWVFTSRDSLFQTFRRALANYASGYAIPRPPAPASSFSVTSADTDPITGERLPIRLAWTPPADASGLAGYEIYRASGAPDSVYTLIHSTGPGETSYDDTQAPDGGRYFYHILSVGRAEDNDGTGETPPGALRSSRYYTQTYHFALALPVAGEPGPEASRFRLHTPAPNPARGAVTVRFELAEVSDVTGIVYSVTGAVVARLADGQPFATGTQVLTWEAEGVAAGVYVARVSAAGETQTARVVLVR